MTFTIAIVGRPNVGKSTLFNRLAGKRLALVDDQPGVTRDRREGEGRLGDLSFRIIDTAGLEEGPADSLSERMRAQTQAGLEEADIALMLMDARVGLTPLDHHFCDWIRRLGTPTVLVANKAEGEAARAGYYEAFALGLGEPVAFSAEHGEGLSELYAAICQRLEEAGIDPAEQTGDDADKPLFLAIVGRPNAGKSTLINKLIGTDRLVVGPEAGITRDSIAIDWRWQDRAIRLFDTAGLRRRSRVREKLEKLSAADTRRAVQFAEVVVVLLDAQQGLDAQDLKIANEVVEEGRALILALNKWDLIEDQKTALRDVRDKIDRGFAQLRDVPFLTFSAQSGAGLSRLMPAVLQVHERWNRRVPTARLNRWLSETIAGNPPPSVKGKRIKLRYATQIKTRPPTFSFFVNRPELLPESYRRFLINELRAAFDFTGAPIRCFFKRGDNPYDGKSD
ncbi:MAG: ribosome biogenesis GTPase Der [Sphingomonadales bacterium]